MYRDSAKARVAARDLRRQQVKLDFSHYFRWLFANFRECSLIS